MSHGDRGSITPMILLFFLLAALVVMGTASAGSAFLAQRDLQSVCDGAVIAAADALDPATAYHDGADLAAGVPLTQDSVDAAVTEFVTTSYPRDAAGLSVRATTDGRTASVRCRRVVSIPFGAIFGHPRGLDLTAVASARAAVATG